MKIILISEGLIKMRRILIMKIIQVKKEYKMIMLKNMKIKIQTLKMKTTEETMIIETSIIIWTITIILIVQAMITTNKIHLIEITTFKIIILITSQIIS